MRVGNLSYKLISEALKPLITISSDTVEIIVKQEIDHIEIPKSEDISILHYDEQHPKKERTQKYRLSLLDGKTKTMVGEILTDELNSEIIKKFFDDYLPHNRIIFIVTDLAKIYTEILEEIRPGFIIHQHCLLHLNKMIVKDFDRYCPMDEEYLKYELLNIFYDRSEEVDYLRDIVKKEIYYIKKHGDQGYFKWLKNEKNNFHEFIRSIEKTRRRKSKKLGLPNRMTMWTLDEAKNNFSELLKRINTFPKEIQRRLLMINNDWKRLSAFYYLNDAPATNNLIENYFSCSCKQIKKKQHRRTSSLIRQWKLYQIHRAGLLIYHGRNFSKIISLLKMIDSRYS